MKPFLDFLTRPGCHLCEEAWPVAQRAAALTRTGLTATDIDSEDDLVADWGLRIPVVRWTDGTVLAEGRIHLFPLVRAILPLRLERPSGSPPSPD